MYRKKIYERYLISDGFSDFDAIEKQFNSPFYVDENTKHSLPKNKNAKILDIGCGFGRFLKYLKDNGYENIQGIEIGEEQNKFLKNKGYQIIQQDIVKYLKTTNEKFDFISLFDVLEHFTKVEIVELLPLLKNRLEDDGILLIRVPDGEAMYKGGIMYGDFTHEIFFTLKSIKQLFNIFDFNKTDVFLVYPIKHGLKSIIRYYGYRFYELIYKLGIVFGSWRFF
jgi:SAM-dependent methyltransferase